MLPFLALHAIAAPRGEGLRPEFLERFRRIAGNQEFDFPSRKNGQAASIPSGPNSSAVARGSVTESVSAKREGLSSTETPAKELDLPIDIRGTPFQRRVWDALLGVPARSTVTYAALAARIGEPKSARAVANACAANANALAIPCHRVLRSDGTFSGHRWVEKRKRALIEDLPRSRPNAADAATVAVSCTTGLAPWAA
jgi:O-6-methylguanine DNA methyltransferase